MNNYLINKYKEDFINIIKLRCQIKSCLAQNCKSFVVKLHKKNISFIKKVQKISNDYNSTKAANNLNKDILELTNKFNQNKHVLEHNKYIFPPKPIPKNVTTKYNKEFKKKINDINKLKKDFINSKEVQNLRKCRIEKCNDLHVKTIELAKNFSKKLCEDEKDKYFCKLYKLVKKINIKKLDYNKISKLKYLK
jgi:hypothetical protein